jgi:hypothetical protein
VRGSTMFIAARWGLIPYWVKDPKGGAQPINARSETVKTNGMFKAAYQSRRALMPIDGFFEWKDILGTGKNKQPYAIAMKSGGPFLMATEPIIDLRLKMLDRSPIRSPENSPAGFEPAGFFVFLRMTR